ncbi:MAG: hypothetical protein ACP5N2_00145 [Candidatus Nanoarchaeia archaeon]
MGLFGLGKKKGDPLAEFNPSNMGGSIDTNPQSFNTGYTDPMMDPNSGLKLADLNPQNQDTAFNQTQSPMDSFGNPRPQSRMETFESKQTSFAPSQDTSRDLQLIIAKLDAIRSEITNINHRLDNIERHQQETPQKKYPW